jgi:phosphoglycerate dehydrogenase-like enzyme
MRVLYAGPRRKPEVEAELRVAYRSLPDLLAESDHVVLAAPLTPDTRHLIDAGALRVMRAGATLVNVSRGGLVDHDALAAALAEGVIGRAALDVTDPEPIPPHHPLVGLPNCLIVPHIGSASVRTRRAMADLAVANLLAGLAGRELPACANH